MIKNKEVEIMSKEENLWNRFKGASESRLKQLEENIIVEKAMIEMSKKKIEESKLK